MSYRILNAETGDIIQGGLSYIEVEKFREQCPDEGIFLFEDEDRESVLPKTIKTFEDLLQTIETPMDEPTKRRLYVIFLSLSADRSKKELYRLLAGIFCALTQLVDNTPLWIPTLQSLERLLARLEEKETQKGGNQ